MQLWRRAEPIIVNRDGMLRMLRANSLTTVVVNDTDSSVGIMGGLDTQE